MAAVIVVKTEGKPDHNMRLQTTYMGNDGDIAKVSHAQNSITICSDKDVAQN